MVDQTASRRVREVITGAPSSSMPFSKAIGYGDLVFISGLIGRHPETHEIGPDIASQTSQAMRNVQHQLELAGSSMDKVLKVTVFILDMKQFKAMNDAYRRFFIADPPTRSCVEVTSLPDGDALVEIEVIAGR